MLWACPQLIKDAISSYGLADPIMKCGNPEGRSGTRADGVLGKCLAPATPRYSLRSDIITLLYASCQQLLECARVT